MDAGRAGTGYLALPTGNRGPGVLVLHSWFGLNDDVRAACDGLAAAGFVALAPDLFDGATATEVDAGEALLLGADANELAHVTRSALHTLRGLPAVTAPACGVVGFSMGGSLALWLAARAPEGVAAAVTYYASQETDLDGATGAFLGHFAADDPFVDADSLVLLEADLHLLEREVTFHRYDGTRHWFAEPSRPEHAPAAAALAWDRTVEFLTRWCRGPVRPR